MSYQLQYLGAGGRVNLQSMTDELAELGGQTPDEDLPRRSAYDRLLLTAHYRVVF